MTPHKPTAQVTAFEALRFQWDNAAQRAEQGTVPKLTKAKAKAEEGLKKFAAIEDQSAPGSSFPGPLSF